MAATAILATNAAYTKDKYKHGNISQRDELDGTSSASGTGRGLFHTLHHTNQSKIQPLNIDVDKEFADGKHHSFMADLSRNISFLNMHIPISEELDMKTFLSNCMHIVCSLSNENIVYPHQPFKKSWDKLMLLLIGYVTISAPLHISFHLDITVVIDIIVILFFMLDVWINLHTTYLHQTTGEYELDPTKIRKQYFKTWFFIDFIASIPLGEISILLNMNDNIQELFTLLHLLRIFKVIPILKHFDLSKHSTALRLLLCLFLGFSHLGACTFHYFGQIHPESGWLTEEDLLHESKFKRYISAYYWALGTITTVVYGDIHAITFDERLFSCLMVLVSAVVYALLLAYMSLILGEIFHSNHEENVNQKMIEKYETNLRLTSNLSKTIDNINKYHSQNKYRVSLQFLLNECNELPISVKYRILQKTLYPVLKYNATFGFIDKNILLQLAHYLQYCVCIPNEYIFLKNDVMNKVYILRSGRVTILPNCTLPELDMTMQGSTSQTHSATETETLTKADSSDDIVGIKTDTSNNENTNKNSDQSLCLLRKGAHFGEIPLFQLDQCDLTLNSTSNAAAIIANEQDSVDIDRDNDETVDSRSIKKKNQKDDNDIDDDKNATIKKYYARYEASKSPFAAKAVTSCVLYSISYKHFKRITMMNPYVYQLFKTIALARSKQTVKYNDEKLCTNCFQCALLEQ